jgi:Undecaprenyl-phosphate galactose phosphotransferase WbaP
MAMSNRLHHESVSSDLGALRYARGLAKLVHHEPAGGRTTILLRAALLVVADITAFLLALCVSAVFVASTPAALVTPDATLQSLTTGYAPVLLGVLIYCGVRAHYQHRLLFWIEARQLLLASIVALTATGFFAFWTGSDIPRAPVAVTWLLFPALAILLRGGARLALNAAGLWRIRVLVVGAGETSRQALDALRSQPRLGYEVAEIVGARVLETFHARGQLPRILDRFHADMLILATEPADWPGRAVIQSLIRARIPFAVMREMDGLPVMGCEQTSFFSHDTVMMSYRNNLAKPVARLAKLSLDVALASLALLILAPLFLLIAIAIKLDGGPVFYAHKRIGADGRTFQCLKFRSMVMDSERVLRDLLARDPAAAQEWARTQKLRNDPRITKVGALLRQTSLDELPQLLNVLRLEMSLVGPRPIVAAEVPKYADDIAFYCETRPGITGLWQVSGRSDTSYARRVQLDSWYVKNWTVWHDLTIIAKTVPAVLKRRGAV